MYLVQILRSKAIQLIILGYLKEKFLLFSIRFILYIGVNEIHGLCFQMSFDSIYSASFPRSVHIWSEIKFIVIYSAC